MNSLSDIIKSRRTIPLFETHQEVSQDLIDAAVEAASWAPNHHLTEPWHFYQLGVNKTAAYIDLLYDVINEYKGEALAQSKMEKAKTVPGWLVVTCSLKADTNLMLVEDYAAVCCAIQNLCLVLWDSGVGSKWSTGIITRDDRFYDVLGIDRRQQEIVGLIPFGYPKKMPDARARKPLAEILTKTD